MILNTITRLISKKCINDKHSRVSLETNMSYMINCGSFDPFYIGHIVIVIFAFCMITLGQENWSLISLNSQNDAK